MTTKLNNPDFQSQFKDEPVEWKGKWRNLILKTDGTWRAGYNLFCTKEDAAEGAKAFYNDLDEAQNEGCVGIEYEDGTTDYCADFTRTALQIPVKD